MSICKCPVVDPERQKGLVQGLLDSVKQDPDWSLLTLSDLYNAGNSIEDLAETVPFRGGPCKRSIKCCGMCTRQCYHRCIQDCLHRLYIWRQMVKNNPEGSVPMAIRMAVSQQFETLEDMSWVIGEILARKTNTHLKEFMEHEKLRPEENPYKIDYAPQPDIDWHTGRRRVDEHTGRIRYLDWPATGLCPFCLPTVTIDGRVARRGRLKS